MKILDNGLLFGPPYSCMLTICCWHSDVRPVRLFETDIMSKLISTFVALYKSMVRSYLDYCCPVWPPFR